MAGKKKLLDFESPISASGNILDISAWTGGILWVVMFGMIMAMGTKLLSAVDSRIPGNQTPNIKPYTQVSTGNGLNIL